MHEEAVLLTMQEDALSVGTGKNLRLATKTDDTPCGRQEIHETLRAVLQETL